LFVSGFIVFLLNSPSCTLSIVHYTAPMLASAGAVSRLCGRCSWWNWWIDSHLHDIMCNITSWRESE